MTEEKSHNPEYSETIKDCNNCHWWRSRANKHKGVLVPGRYGKCIRPGGHCDPDVVRKGIGE